MKRIALSQLNVGVGNREKNVATAMDYIQKACDHHTDLILFPELWSSGFDYAHMPQHAENNRALLDRLQQISDENGLSIGGSYILLQDQGFVNSFVLMQPNTPPNEYHKIHLFSLMKEDHHFIPGNRSEPISTSLGRTGLAICFDVRFPLHFWNLTREGCEVFLVSSHWPLARITHWDTLLRARAIENQAYVIAVNSVGLIGKEVFGGHSTVIAPDGQVIHRSIENEEGLTFVEINPSLPTEIRKTFPITK